MAMKNTIGYALAGLVFILAFAHGFDGDGYTDKQIRNSNTVIIPSCSKNDTENSYCDCKTSRIAFRTSITIKCSFNNEKDVLLTDTFYSHPNPESIYIRIVNASSVNITSTFLKKLMKSPSIALDVWRVKTLHLSSTPELESKHRSFYKSFFGVGIVSCFVPEVPKYFMRDTIRGAFRIKNSRVGIFHEGALHNIKEMRYLAFDHTTVDLFAGSVATEGYVTFSALNLHSWNGLLFINSTINTIRADTFKIINKAENGNVQITGNRIGRLSKRAFEVTGNFNVQIENNIFEQIEKKAMKVNITGELSFNKNEMSNWDLDALKSLICPEQTSLEENIFHISNSTDFAIRALTKPFHNSCNDPQLSLALYQVGSAHRFLN